MKKEDNIKIKTNVTKNENAQVDLEITIDKSEIKAEFKKAIAEVGKKVKIPGFRQGKVPETVLRNKFLPNIKYNVINELIPRAMQKALDENDLKAFSQPSFDEIDDISEKEDFTFSAHIEIPPSMELVKYSGFSLKKNIYSYDKSQIEEYIEQMRKSQGAIKPKEGDVAEDDVCLVEFAYYVEEEQKAKRSGMVEVNKKDPYFGEYYSELIGMKKDEEKEISVKIPDFHPDKELVGKKGALWIKIINISQREIPTLDDEFAKDMGFENVDQLKLNVEKKLEKACENNAKEDLTDEIIEKIIKECEFDIPQSLVDSQSGQMVMNLNYYLRQSGQNLQMYLKEEGKTMEEFMEEQKEKAAKYIKQNLIISEIAKEQDIKVEDDDINKYLTEYSEEHDAALSKLKADYEKQDIKNAVDSQVLAEKVIDYVIENSKVGKGEKKKLEF